jgi:hypothetical protein
MGECPVGFCHPMGFFPLADCQAFIINSIQKFICQTFLERLSFLGSGGFQQPTSRQGELAVGRDFHRDLVSGTTDPAGANLHPGACILNGLLKQLNRILPSPFGHDLKCVVYQIRCNVLFAFFQDMIDKGLYLNIVVPDIRLNLSPVSSSPSHQLSPSIYLINI